ncbi:MAG: 50S ribosomal protein L23 [Sphingobacteriales bacterium]|jgi:large subunit ribosomal protein L23|nr:MAG: 50S ribosomal protein L23 [Sphingobacteriales bacterium]
MDILRKPVLSEKANLLTEKLNRYTFKCDPRANKLQIKSAIEAMYGVNIASVNTMVVMGKTKTRSTKAGQSQGRAAKHKKAVITLKQGEIIDFYSNI